MPKNTQEGVAGKPPKSTMDDRAYEHRGRVDTAIDIVGDLRHACAMMVGREGHGPDPYVVRIRTLEQDLVRTLDPDGECE